MAQLISTKPNLTQHQLILTFMDCFGSPSTVYLSLVDGPAMEDKITSTLAAITAKEDKVKASCAAINWDLTQQLADGAAAIAAALAEAKG